MSNVQVVVRVSPYEVVTVVGTAHAVELHRRFVELHQMCEKPADWHTKPAAAGLSQTTFGQLAGSGPIDTEWRER